ncbi:hypothetical protein A1O3_04905 [Capronia epimyces CBS 606.96]|uniref:Uncharacterized protein n=1 Tax=Capronia epimyces CBS 606.96 TaxID=1182542 RepID=W9XVH5_9EURO|nr:uncharacterized protein A1O3_04905 [Capronia epimyces CBS 606.96]EXJ84238.1 hypothetical protein A1O3_04905 [Capronia epimyces CBS 606.96]
MVPASTGFWDNLPKIQLTKNARRELDRRNTQAALNSQLADLHSHQQITQTQSTCSQSTCSQSLIPASEYLGSCRPKTLAKIKLSARNGGPYLSDLRDPLNRAMSFKLNPSDTERDTEMDTEIAQRSQSCGPYDGNFVQNLEDGGVYLDAHEFPKPANWTEIHQRLSQPRPSLSGSMFSEEEFLDFVARDESAKNEKMVKIRVIPIIEGRVKDWKCVAGENPFTNLDPLTAFTLAPGTPDTYYGARPEQLSLQVRDELSNQIIPSPEVGLPMVPNFFLQVKGPNGTPAVAIRQACYNGALGARGLHSLQSYGQDHLPSDNNAYTITNTYLDGTLKMYLTQRTQSSSPGSRPKYYMHMLGGWCMTGNLKTFREGAAYYRNGMEWAEEQRNEAIRRANERVGWEPPRRYLRKQ